MFETQYMLVPFMAFPGPGEHRSPFCSPGEAKLGSSGFVGSWDDFYVQLYSIYIPRIGNDRKGSIINNRLVVSNIFYFPQYIYGMSSFPLTNTFFKMVKTTNQVGNRWEMGSLWPFT